MTIKELIEQLQKQQQDKEVVACVVDNGYGCMQIQYIAPYCKNIHIKFR